jgi:transglutaminase-like putative cysteine protease
MAAFLWASALVLPVAADGPLVHEYFEPEEQEDLDLGATTQAGTMSAALSTPSGVVRAPDARRAPSQRDRAYGGSATPSSPDATYRIDRNTTQPGSVHYDDPFNPSIVPFKRLYAFDTVRESFELGVRDPKLTRLEVGGTVRPGDDQFYGDLVVDLSAGDAVRIPSVGPGARVLGYETYPRVELGLWHDGADNWFAQGKERMRVRLTLQIAIERTVFGGEFPDVDYRALPPPAPLPPAVASAAETVLGRLGLARTLRPRVALDVLVDHFRSFAASDELPHAVGAAELYQELALGQKGVCRHRAYAFVLSALGLGLPARFVRNEAHAWVEVHDGSRWRRIDLGGAAARFDVAAPLGAFEHVPLADPFRWPAGSERTQASSRHLSRPPNSSPVDALVPLIPLGPRAAAPSGTAEPEPTDARSERGPSSFTVHEAAASVLRGGPLSVAGRVEAGGEGCAGLRVDVALRGELGNSIPLGSLATGPDGTFAGSVTVGPNLEVGDYRLVLSTPGNSTCGPGRRE